MANTFIIVVLTLYFLSSLPTIKDALYRLAPGLAPRPGHRARRPDDPQRRRLRLRRLPGRPVRRHHSLIFLFIVGLGEYAVALAFVVALLDVIPMIGATLGASS